MGGDKSITVNMFGGLSMSWAHAQHFVYNNFLNPHNHSTR